MSALGLDDIFLLGGTLIVILFLFKILIGPIKKVIGLLINSVLGAILLVVVNYFGALFGVTIGINLLTAVIAGVFGIPGVLFLIIYQLFL